MGLRLCLFAVAVMFAACQRTQSPPPVPTPSVTPIHAVAGAPSTPSASVGAPSPAVSPDAEEASDDDDDDIDKPWSSDFEIDADANWYYGFAPMNVAFTAKPLTGSPPFAYTWDFADGSPQATGESAAHRYEKVGRYTPSVTGKDGKGETYTVSFIIVVVTREEYAERKGVDPAVLQQLPLSSPTP